MKWIKTLIFLATISCLESCAPVFSEMQSARTIGKNNVEVMPSYTVVDYTHDNETKDIQSHVGAQLSLGTDSNTDIRVRYEYIWLTGNNFEGGVSAFGAGAKFGLVKNRIAFSFTLGNSYGEELGNWQLHPTLLLTQPILKDVIDLTLSSKYLIVICEDCDNLLAFNLGLSLGDDLSKWSLRPEYGMLFNPNSHGVYHQFSVGAAMTFGK